MPNPLGMPDWMYKLYFPYLPQPTGATPFVPAFETIKDVSTAGSSVLSNSLMYVTPATAQALAAKFGANHIEERVDESTPLDSHTTISEPGADQSDVGQQAKQRILIFTAGAAMRNNNGDIIGAAKTDFEINAGMLASSYFLEPEANFPETISMIGWPPSPVKVLSNAERDAWAKLRVLAGVPLA
jgi:hypothetical protein